MGSAAPSALDMLCQIWSASCCIGCRMSRTWHSHGSLPGSEAGTSGATTSACSVSCDGFLCPFRQLLWEHLFHRLVAAPIARNVLSRSEPFLCVTLLIDAATDGKFG